MKRVWIVFVVLAVAAIGLVFWAQNDTAKNHQAEQAYYTELFENASQQADGK